MAEMSSSISIFSAEEKKDDSNGMGRLPVDRYWIQKLVSKHRNRSTPTNAPESQACSKEEPVFVLAPMVDQSDLPFRLLTRRYGCDLCFTPMIHAVLFNTGKVYREKFRLEQLPQSDRPVIAQICGSDPTHVLKCAQALEPYCDGIDINCGCPQQIARRGNYGAFFLEQEDALVALVEHLVAHLRVPLSVKVRLLPADTRDESVARSLRLYHRLVGAGIHLLTIHGRTRLETGPRTAATDWLAIAQVVKELGDKIPIFANGSVGSRLDAMQCWKETGVDGIMSSEAILEYPALFALDDPNSGQRSVSRIALAQEYLELAKEYPPHKGGQASFLKCMRVHLHRMLHADLQPHEDLRQFLVDADTEEALHEAVRLVALRQQELGHDVRQEHLTWYVRHRNLQTDSNGLVVNSGKIQQARESTVVLAELTEDTAECFTCLFDEDEY